MAWWGSKEKEFSYSHNFAIMAGIFVIPMTLIISYSFPKSNVPIYDTYVKKLLRHVLGEIISAPTDFEVSEERLEELTDDLVRRLDSVSEENGFDRKITSAQVYHREYPKHTYTKEYHV